MSQITVGSRVRLRGTDIIGYVLEVGDKIDFEGARVLWQDITGTKRSNLIDALCLYGEQPELQTMRVSVVLYTGQSEVEANAVVDHSILKMRNKEPIKGSGVTIMIDDVYKRFELETGNYIVSIRGIVVEGAEKFDSGQTSTSFEIVNKIPDYTGSPIPDNFNAYFKECEMQYISKYEKKKE